MALNLLLVALAAYLGLSLLAWLFQARLVWFPGGPPLRTPREYGLEYEDVALTTADGLRLSAWWLPVAEEAGCVLVCHGNAGNIEHRLLLARAFQAMGLSVLLFDYRGYGASEGRPTEEGTYRDAEAAFDWLAARREPARIAVYGESLGGAVALELAQRRPAAALVLESAFTSIPALGARLYPLLPVKLVATIRYDNLAKIGGLRVPLLILHSPADDIVPFDCGQELFAAAPAPKEFLATSGSHNDGGFQLRAEWQDRVRDFLRRSLPARPLPAAEPLAPGARGAPAR